MTSMGFILRHAIGVLAAIAVALWAVFYVPATPSYTIYQLKQAIDQRDGATAASFVDFPSVVKNAGYEMLQQNAKGNDVIAALVGKGAVDFLSAPLAAAIQQWATQQVNSGAKQLQMPGAAVLGSIVMLHRSGDTAWTDFRDNKGVEWNIRMARENGHWRISEVKNVQQLLQHFEQQRMRGGTTPPSDNAPDNAVPGGPSTSP
jgi:hypothetical protein